MAMFNYHVRRGTAAELATLGVMVAGEMGFTTDTHLLYLSDGGTNYLIGGGSTTNELGDLDDVTITSVADNEVLSYDSATGDWINQTLGEMGGVDGPASSTDHAIPRWDGVGGDTLLNSGVTIDDTNNVAMAGNLDMSAGAYDLLLKDNEAAALEIKQATTAYLTFVTTDAGEKIQTGKPLNIQGVFTLPSVDGTANQMMKTNGSGVLSWTTPAGGGDVVGPASATDNAIARFSLTTGKLIQNSGVTVDDSNNLVMAGNLNMAAAGYDVLMPDNTAAALEIKEGANAYLTFVTTDAGEKITLGKKLEAGAVEIEGTAFDINGGAIDDTTIGAGTAAAGTFTTVTTGGNLDMSAGAYDLLILDNNAAALEVKEGANAYLTFDTTNAAEKILASKEMEFDAGIDLDGNLDMSTGAYDVELKDAEAAALEFKESTNAYLTFVTSDGTEVVKIEKTLDLDANLDMSTGAYDILLKDAEAAALEIKEAGNAYLTIVTSDGSETVKVSKTLDLDANLDMATGAYDLLIKDNEAASLEIKEGANAYLTFVTTDSSESVTLGQKLLLGSFASPFDVTATREYGVELHVSGNNYSATGIRSRGRLKTTDAPTKTAQGAVLQAANEDGINAGVLQGALIEAIGKSTTTAATISDMRGVLVNTEWDAKDTVTNLKVAHIRTHTRDAATEGYFSGTGYGVYIENEAVGGNGQALTAGIYLKGTNLSAGNDAYVLGLDFSGASITTADIKLADGGMIGGSGADFHIADDGQAEFRESAHFGTEIDDGDTGASDTIDWGVSNKHKSTLTANCTFTYTAPTGCCNLVHRLVQGGSGSYTVTWPGTVHWAGGTAPTLSTAVGAVDIVCFYWDGTNYHGQTMLDSKSP